MEERKLTEEERCQLDVGGYLILPGVLTSAELTACNRALDRQGPVEGPLRWSEPAGAPLLALRHHPVLTGYLEQICGKFRVDESPRLLGVGAEANGTALTGGGEPLDWSRAYDERQESLSRAVRVVWALADAAEGDGGLVVVPASHISTVEPPRDLVSGADDMGLVRQPALRAGDLMIHAASLLTGLRPWRGQGPQRLLACGYVGASVRPSADSEIRGEDDGDEEWRASLTPEQRALVHNPNRPYPPPVVMSDGERAWLEEEGGVHHPSIYTRDEACGIDEKEFYHWDLCGHLVLRGVMDAEWLAAVNEAVDAHANPSPKKGGSAAGHSRRLAGTGGHRSSLGNPWKLPAPHGEPFQRMIAHPALVQRLNWMMGSGYEAMLCTSFLFGKGSSGHLLHAGGGPPRVSAHYRQRNGRVYAESLNVAWQLRDVTAADGGFVCVPGSHKTRFRAPDCVLTCDDELGLVRHVEMEAGDVLLFLASAQTHGAYPWTGEQDRRAIFFQYRSRNLYSP